MILQTASARDLDVLKVGSPADGPVVASEENLYQDDEAALEDLARGVDPHVPSPQSEKTQDDDQPGGGG